MGQHLHKDHFPSANFDDPEENLMNLEQSKSENEEEAEQRERSYSNEGAVSNHQKHVQVLLFDAEFTDSTPLYPESKEIKQVAKVDTLLISVAAECKTNRDSFHCSSLSATNQGDSNNFDQYLIFRGPHYCKDNERFVSNFQKLFEGGCVDLLQDVNVYSDDLLTEW